MWHLLLLPGLKKMENAMTDTLTTLVDGREKQLAWSEVGMKSGVDYKFAQYFASDDGGREEAGRKGDTGDCVARAIAITTGLHYQQVYDRLAEGNATQRKGKHEPDTKAGKRTASRGINTKRKWFKDYMAELGFAWTPTMFVGSGCKVHCRSDELPSGRLILNLSKHFTTMIDGVIHDTYDPSREGTRCVYGYWKKGQECG